MTPADTRWIKDALGTVIVLANLVMTHIVGVAWQQKQVAFAEMNELKIHADLEDGEVSKHEQMRRGE